MRTRLLAAPMLGLAVLVAACSGSSATTAPTAAPTAAPTTAPSAEAPSAEAPSAAASPAMSPAAGGAAGVTLADSKLGKILVGANGMTLYIFTPDGSGGKSTCTAQCIASWPALTSDTAPTLGTGLDAEDFTSTTRDDGGKQVVFYGMPLYYYSGDKAAGDTNGQGLFSKWYVIGADGKPIQASSSTGSTY